MTEWHFRGALTLNGVKATINERVAAARARMVGAEPVDSQCSRLRMTLVLAELDVDGSETALDLSHRGLDRVIDLVSSTLPRPAVGVVVV